MLSQTSEHNNTAPFWVVIANGGIGSRFGSSHAKQYSGVAGKTLFEWTLAQFLARSDIAGIVIPSHPQDPHVSTQLGVSDPRVALVDGGVDRAHSVLNGLVAVADQAEVNDWVLVHDVARPLLLQTDIDQLLQYVRSHDHGAILASPIADTIKRVNHDNSIEATVSRTQLWGAQTPQCFRLGELLVALKNAIDNGENITDEASAMEIAGHTVGIVPGSRRNIKVTYPEDLVFAASQLRGNNE